MLGSTADMVWVSRSQLLEIDRLAEETKFLLMVAEEESKAIHEALIQADAIIEELIQENGKLTKQVEDMDLIIRKGCACTRVWE